MDGRKILIVSPVFQVTHCSHRVLAFYLSILCYLFLCSPASAETLSSKTLDLVAQAVFEVVVTKPAEGTIEYKDPLPL